MVAWLSGNNFGTTEILPEISLLHYSHGIVSLHFDYSESELCSQWRDDEHWLIYIELGKFNPVTGDGVNVIKPPGNASKLFVRNTDSYYFYGTHTGLGAHGHHEWKIHSHSLADSSPLPPHNPPLQLDEFVGSDIGSTVAFEIHGAHFYAVSNQTSFVVEEVDWTSFYHCIRFPLHRPVKEALEVNTRVYRRQHAEGPINDSWTDLTLQVDERTNLLQIVEARREWRNGGSKQERTFYTHEVTFPKPSARRRQTAHGAVVATTPSAAASASVSSDNDELPERETNDPDEEGDGAASPSLQAQGTLLLPPNDLLVSTIGSGNNPHYAPVEERLPRSYHPERRHDDGQPSPAQSFILARTKLRTYNLSCSAFLDLVEDEACCPASAAVGGPPCLRIRIGARKRQSFLPIASYSSGDGERSGKGKDRQTAEARETMISLPPYEDRFSYPPIRLWPPTGESGGENAVRGEHTCARKLHDILNAPLMPPSPAAAVAPVSAKASCGTDGAAMITSPTSVFSQLSFSSQLSACSSVSAYTPPPPATETVAAADERSVVFLRRPKYGSGERSGPIVLVSFDRGIEAGMLAYTAKTAERKDSGIPMVDNATTASFKDESGCMGSRANRMLWRRDECWNSEFWLKIVCYMTWIRNISS
ncbi:hypothetical protein MPH_01852 [Macrophomina phaseolina MS6]|uniref:Uncharacterized protein n=1 Tax=Macrophomina phaseolina (strain MS6) TaxID=1126212 RepID=K2S1C5_MACPH|nr:hypothetical protein MPH_01852 [Macrophomina phaseolina MS6]